MDPMDEIRATFFVECGELMEQLEAGLLDLEAGDVGPDTIDAVFRAVHSIKGGAAAFELSGLVSFAHEFESALDRIRSGELSPDEGTVAALLRACDQLGDLVDAARAGEDRKVPVPDEIAAMAASGALADPATEDAAEPEGFDAVPIMLDLMDEVAPDAAVDEPPARDPGGSVRTRATRWRITFEPLPDFLASGNEPLYLFRALSVLGRVEARLQAGGMPPLAELDPEHAFLRWSLDLTPAASDLTETEIESVFEFVHDICVLEIAAVSAEPNGPGDPEPGPVESDAKPRPAPVAAPIAVKSSVDGFRPPAPPAASPAKVVTRTPSTTIRVDLDRIDRLVNLAGELVITQSMVSQTMLRGGGRADSETVACIDELQQLARDMQESVMAIRAQPVQPLFQRMTRIVREAAQATGKKVRLRITGEGTEIDKTVVESLADPLTHMIRNAVDHGIEPPDQRHAAGKDPTGTIVLSARQQSDRVVIRVADDGRGIDRARVYEKAVSSGLVPPDKELQPEEIDRLIFAPGFSTAKDVSALSGRGVGMNVVHQAIRELNGTITVGSTEGSGSLMTISLPLTLAILDGMIVMSDRQRIVIPVAAIIETQTLSSARIEQLTVHSRLAKLHDRFVPLIDLAHGMGFARPAAATGQEDASILFIQPDDEPPYAIQVDRIEAQRQVVVKGLGENFGRIPCVSAATVLGDGRVAFILDPAEFSSRSVSCSTRYH
jgi:two-component system chemotaxis sensor kinase CheA